MKIPDYLRDIPAIEKDNELSYPRYLRDTKAIEKGMSFKDAAKAAASLEKEKYPNSLKDAVAVEPKKGTDWKKILTRLGIGAAATAYAGGGGLEAVNKGFEKYDTDRKNENIRKVKEAQDAKVKKAKDAEYTSKKNKENEKYDLDMKIKRQKLSDMKEKATGIKSKSSKSSMSDEAKAIKGIEKEYNSYVGKPVISSQTSDPEVQAKNKEEIGSFGDKSAAFFKAKQIKNDTAREKFISSPRFLALNKEDQKVALGRFSKSNDDNWKEREAMVNEGGEQANKDAKAPWWTGPAGVLYDAATTQYDKNSHPVIENVMKQLGSDYTPMEPNMRGFAPAEPNTAFSQGDPNGIPEAITQQGLTAPIAQTVQPEQDFPRYDTQAGNNFAFPPDSPNAMPRDMGSYNPQATPTMPPSMMNSQAIEPTQYPPLQLPPPMLQQMTRPPMPPSMMNSPAIEPIQYPQLQMPPMQLINRTDFEEAPPMPQPQRFEEAPQMPVQGGDVTTEYANKIIVGLQEQRITPRELGSVLSQLYQIPEIANMPPMEQRKLFGIIKAQYGSMRT